MRIERSKAWWLAKAQREGDSVIGAGLLAFDAKPEDVTVRAATAEETRIAFGRFVNLMRRRRGLSVERLAEAANIEASELLVIEEDVQYVPEPRTVYCLAQAFDVPQQSLLQLSGLAKTNDAGFQREAVRFAARSESVQKLSAEESAALDAFVTVLSQSKSKPVK